MTSANYWFWDSVIPKEFCEQLITQTNWPQNSNAEVIQNNLGVSKPDGKKRVTDIVWESNTSPVGCIAQVYANMANKKSGWDLELSFCEDIQMSRYRGDVSGFYDWHKDAEFFVDNRGTVRKLSAIIMLSDPRNYEGGFLEFKGFDKPLKLNQGSIVIFPSQLEHRVTPVTSGVRCTAVTWVNGPAFR